MEDMDEARTAKGTVADFSGWNVNNKYGKMKITSSEKVIEPEIDSDEKKPEDVGDEFEMKEETIDKTKQREKRIKELEAEQARLLAEAEAEKKEQERKNRPGKNSFNINIKYIGEIKELAKKLLPKVNEVKQEEYQIACELAINLAMTFEGIWEQKIGGVDEERK